MKACDGLTPAPFVGWSVPRAAGAQLADGRKKAIQVMRRLMDFIETGMGFISKSVA